MPSATKVLLIVNAIPLAAVALLGWNVYTITMLYWAENGVVGLYTVAKMTRSLKKGSLGKSKGYQYIFFVTHYSTFWVMHGAFLFLVLFRTYPEGLGSRLLFLVFVIPFAISHGVSFVHNYSGKSEYTKISSLRLMVTPYTRVLGHSAALLVGAYAILRLGESPLYLVLLMAAKTALDLYAHHREHRAFSKM